VKYGIFDAPHLKNNQYALGKITTKIINGACYSWDDSREKKYDEIKRIKNIIFDLPDTKLSDLFKQKEKSIFGVMDE